MRNRKIGVLEAICITASLVAGVFLRTYDQGPSAAEQAMNELQVQIDTNRILEEAVAEIRQDQLAAARRLGFAEGRSEDEALGALQCYALLGIAPEGSNSVAEGAYALALDATLDAVDAAGQR